VVLSYNLLLKAQYRSESGDIHGAATVRNFPSGFSAPRLGSFWFLFRDGFPEEVLVFRFGSTPVAIRDYESAMPFIWYYRQNAFPGCLAWVRTMPLNCTAAIALARERRANEAEPSLPRALVDIRARPIPGVIKYPPDFALHQRVTPILASQMARRSRGAELEKEGNALSTVRGRAQTPAVVLDCDVQSLFDKVNQSRLIRFVKHRILSTVS